MKRLPVAHDVGDVRRSHFTGTPLTTLIRYTECSMKLPAARSAYLATRIGNDLVIH
jgi:hypothetical protein